MSTFSVTAHKAKKEPPYRGQPAAGVSAIVEIAPPIVIGEAFHQLTGRPHHQATAKIKFLYSDSSRTYLQVEVHGHNVDDSAIGKMCYRISEALSDPTAFARFSTEPLL